MRSTRYFLSTVKEAPAEAELVSHKLMLRAGLIRRLGSGLYTWMPLGLRVMRKVEAVVREEMNRAGALELQMPCVIPSELWLESGRWDAFGPQMLKIKDRHQRDFLFGPTHEEVITDIARREIRSYRQLPAHFSAGRSIKHKSSSFEMQPSHRVCVCAENSSICGLMNVWNALYCQSVDQFFL